jgi:hypothetical protein
VNPVFLQNPDWLIQPEALRSMAAASRLACMQKEQDACKYCRN